MLVYFGDHLPYLGDNQLGYQALGLTQEADWDALRSYETPYVIWANDAAAETLDWDAAAEALDLPETISASFLGAAVLELTGRGEETPWFAFLNALRRVSPVVQKQTWVCSLTAAQFPPWTLVLCPTRWRILCVSGGAGATISCVIRRFPNERQPPDGPCAEC